MLVDAPLATGRLLRAPLVEEAVTYVPSAIAGWSPVGYDRPRVRQRNLVALTGSGLPGLNEELDWHVSCVDGRWMVVGRLGPELPMQTTHISRPAVSPVRATISWIREATSLSNIRIAKLVGITRQALHLWEHGGVVSPPNQGRLFAVRDVLERAQRHHRSVEEMQTWLNTPRGATGTTPAEMLETGEVDRARMYAVAVRSPGIRTVPVWVRHSVPAAFQSGQEHRLEAIAPDADDQPLETPQIDTDAEIG